MNMKAREVLTYILGGIITVGFFAIIGMLIFVDISHNNADMLNLSIGALLSAFATVVGYFYGSSVGSKEKTEILNGKQ